MFLPSNTDQIFIHFQAKCIMRSFDDELIFTRFSDFKTTYSTELNIPNELRVRFTSSSNTSLIIQLADLTTLTS